MPQEIKFGNRYQIGNKIIIRNTLEKGQILGIAKHFIGEHFCTTSYYFGSQETKILEVLFNKNFYVGYSDEKKKFITCYFQEIVLNYLIELEDSLQKVYFRENEICLSKGES